MSTDEASIQGPDPLPHRYGSGSFSLDEARDMITEFVGPFYADQHLTRDKGKSTLCGIDREDVRSDIPFFDHRDGFVGPNVPACEVCADVADRIQNGHRIKSRGAR